MFLLRRKVKNNLKTALMGAVSLRYPEGFWERAEQCHGPLVDAMEDYTVELWRTFSELRNFSDSEVVTLRGNPGRFPQSKQWGFKLIASRSRFGLRFPLMIIFEVIADSHWRMTFYDHVKPLEAILIAQMVADKEEKSIQVTGGYQTRYSKFSTMISPRLDTPYCIEDFLRMPM